MDYIHNLTFAYKTETLGSLYSHALLILLKSSKSKHQVVHEQKFKDLLSSTCQDGVERIVLDLESEAAWVLFLPGVTFCHWIFFHVVKPLMPILPILSICEKLDWWSLLPLTNLANSSSLQKGKKSILTTGNACDNSWYAFMGKVKHKLTGIV